MDSIGAIDWGRATASEEKGPPEYIAMEARPLLEMLSEAVPGTGAEEGWIISVVELLAIVALATRQGDRWRDELIFYATVNQNVRSSLTRRNPKNPSARHLLRLVERLEAEHGFHITSLFVRTYHNEVADWLTREELKKVHSDLKRARWARLEPPAEWGQMMQDARERPLRLPGEVGPIAEAALRHRALRRGSPVPRPASLAEQTCHELGGPLMPYLTAFVQLGRSEAASDRSPEWVAASLSLDPQGRESEAFLVEVSKHKPSVIICDTPTKLPTQRLEKALEQIGYQVSQH